MQAIHRVVISRPLSELWDEKAPTAAVRQRHLSYEDLRQLVRAGQVRFVIANVGAPVGGFLLVRVIPSGSRRFDRIWSMNRIGPLTSAISPRATAKSRRNGSALAITRPRSSWSCTTEAFSTPITGFDRDVAGLCFRSGAHAADNAWPSVGNNRPVAVV